MTVASPLFDLTVNPPGPAPVSTVSTVSTMTPLLRPSERRGCNAAARKLLEALTRARCLPNTAEQLTLAGYSGEGGIGDSLGAYYTPPELARELTRLLGLDPEAAPVVLDPACGSGHLLFTLPPGATGYGVELEPLSARIARLRLHDRAQVSVCAFEHVHRSFPTARFDALLANPPFGPRGAAQLLDESEETRAERYFTLAALSHLKSGGPAVILLPQGLLTSASERPFRRRVAAHGTLEAAYGLPTSTFAASHASFATVDAWCLRAHPEDVRARLESVRLLDPPTFEALIDELAAPEFLEGRSFEISPQFELGVPGVEQGMGGAWIKVRHGSLQSALERLSQEPPPRAGSAWTLDLVDGALLAFSEATLRRCQQRENKEAPLGTLLEQDGEHHLYTLAGWVTLGADLAQGVAQALTLEGALSTLGHAQHLASGTREGAGEAEDLEKLRQRLSDSTFRWVAQYGPPHGGPYAGVAPALSTLRALISPTGEVAPSLSTPRPTRVLSSLERLHERYLRGESLRWSELERQGYSLSELCQQGWCLHPEGGDFEVLPMEAYYCGDADALLGPIDEVLESASEPLPA